MPCILESDVHDEQISCFHYVSAFTGPILACALGALFCIVPAHNVLEEPEYWYEFQLTVMLVLPFLYLIGLLVVAEYWANFTFENRLISYIFLLSLALGVHVGTIAIYYYFWTVRLGYIQPMPFSMYIAANNSFTAICLALWFRLSKDLRKQPGFWKRFLWFFVTRACNLLTVWFYALFGTSFTRIPSKYQWILALFSPIPREIFTRMFKYLSFKMGLLLNNK